MVHLPPELIDLIVQNIHRSDEATLRACCLAASVFRPPSQKQLHYKLAICASTTHRPRTWAGVAAHLLAHPHLAQYATDLTIKVANDDAPEDVRAAGQVLPKLVCIQRVLLLGEGDVSVDILPRELRTALHAWFFSPPFQTNMRFLQLTNWRNVPGTLLPAIFSVRSVHLTDVAFADFDSEQADPTATLHLQKAPVRVTATERLHMSTSRSNALEYLVSKGILVDTKSLTSLRLLLIGGEVGLLPSAWSLCAQAAPSLRYLQIYFLGDQVETLPVNFPRNLPRLQAVHVVFRIDGEPEGEGTIQSKGWILSPLLTTILAPAVAPVLSKITIGLFVSRTTAVGSALHFHQAQMKSLDAALLANKSIRALVCAARIERSAEERLRIYNTVVESLRSELPLAAEKGLLQFQLE